MGNGDDGFVVQALNPDSVFAKLSINASGGGGNDELQYFASGTLAWSASATIRLDGQAGDDSLAFSNQGRIDGDLKETILGGVGNDSLSTASVEGSGSGKYALTAEGNDGNDFLVIDVRTAGSRTYKTQLFADGGEGDDTSFTLAEVDAFPEVDFSIQIMANGTLDKDGNDLASGAFVEIKLRLFHRFAPKLDGPSQVVSCSVLHPETNFGVPAVERLQPELASKQPGSNSTSIDYSLLAVPAHIIANGTVHPPRERRHGSTNG